MLSGLFADLDPNPGGPLLTGELGVRAGRVRLRPPLRRDGRRWSQLRLDDRDHLEPWEPTSPGRWRDRHTPRAWRAVRSGQLQGARAGGLLPAVIELDGQMCGQLTIGGIMRGAQQSAWIGYWVASPYTGGGIASAAVALAVDHAFERAGLHRLEATVRPENDASQVVLTRCGFRREGVLRRYLHVDGAWRDHLLMATLVEERGAGAVAALVDAGVARRL